MPFPWLSTERFGHVDVDAGGAVGKEPVQVVLLVGFGPAGLTLAAQL